MINDAIIPMGRLRFGSFTSSAEVANISKPVKANKIAAPPVKPHLNRMVQLVSSSLVLHRIYQL